MITIATAAEFIERDYQLTANCNTCRHTAGIDLAALPPGALLAGPDRRPLRCSACGSVDTARTVVAPTWWSIDDQRA